MRCQSPICITNDKGIKGREFTPPPTAEGMAKLWCPQCLKLNNTLVFFSQQTANMVRETYSEYINTDLPKEVKMILEQFAREIVEKLNQEL